MREDLGGQSEVILTGERQDDPDFDDFSILPGIDTFACARLHQTGIQYFDQLAELEELSPEELEKFRLSFGIGKFQLDEWRWSWDESIEKAIDQATKPAVPAGASASMLPALGVAFEERPEIVDSLCLIDGVGAPLEERLNDHGIFQFGQIALWESSNFDEIEETLELPKGAIREKEWKHQASLLGSWAAGLRGDAFIAPKETNYQDLMGSAFGGEVGLRIDKKLGVLYDFEPEVCDELSEIPGLDSSIENQLRELGIFRFRQIAYWTSSVVSVISENLEVAVADIERQKWVAHAGMLDRQKYAGSTLWNSARPTLEELQAVIAVTFENAADLKAHEDFGIVYTDRPGHADDLETLSGLTRSQVFTLNAAGVWCFRQVATWSQSTIDTFTELLGIPAETPYHERWLQKAKSMECSTQEVQIDVEFAASSQDLLRQGAELSDSLGLIFSREPSQVDNLQDIRGVGPKLEERLKACGVYQFRQIALWTPEIAQEFAERLPGVKERWRSDRWQEQAQALHEKTILTPLESPDRSYEETDEDVSLKSEH